MGNNNFEADPQQFDILARKVIAKFTTRQQIFFGEDKGMKSSVRIYISMRDETAGLKRINDIKILELSTNQDIICGRKVRLVIKYKIGLYIEYEDGSHGIIVLPAECPAKARIKTEFPAYISDKEYLSIKNDFFRWIIDIPFSMFDNSFSQEFIDDPTFQSYLIIKDIKIDFDTLNDVIITDDPLLSNGFNKITVTPVHIKITSNLLLKLCTEQDILIQGIPID